MCLTVKQNYPIKKDGTIRYKIVYPYNNVKGKYVSMYRKKVYKCGKTYTKKNRSPNIDAIDAQGFHVFASLRQARSHAFFNDIIIKCQCKGFVAGGDWTHGTKSEIWREITILKEMNR